jgi:hypothetical protein
VVYFKHYWQALLFFWRPKLGNSSFILNFKATCKHSFELALIMLAVLLTLAKNKLIPPGTKFMDGEFDDVFKEVFFFIFIALEYFFMVGISILCGRLLRVLFGIKMNRKESDVLFVLLSNAFFSITLLIAFGVRLYTSPELMDKDELRLGLKVIFLPLAFISAVLWAIRFALTHQLNLFKGIIFFVLCTLIYTYIFYKIGVVISSIFAFIT